VRGAEYHGAVCQLYPLHALSPRHGIVALDSGLHELYVRIHVCRYMLQTDCLAAAGQGLEVLGGAAVGRARADRMGVSVGEALDARRRTS
jgi:hypothetical protein